LDLAATEEELPHHHLRIRIPPPPKKKTPLETSIERLEEGEIRSSESNGLEVNRMIFALTFE